MIYDFNHTGFFNEVKGLRTDMKSHDRDLVVSIWGEEGTGKSTFAENLAVLLDPSLSPTNLQRHLAQTFQDFARRAPQTKEFESVWWDEAHRFSKRGMYDDDMNRVLLEYFQDIRGRKRIFILCYPEIQEIDRKVIRRSRLFFETAKQGDSYYARGWSRKQVINKLEEMRVFSYKSKMQKWIGIQREPIRTLAFDYKGIEALHEEYKKFKASSLNRSDQKLSQYGYYDMFDVAGVVIERIGRSKTWTYDKAKDVVKNLIIDGTLSQEEVFKVMGRGGEEYRIKTEVAFNQIVNALCEMNILSGGKIQIVDTPQVNRNVGEKLPLHTIEVRG